ncbi:TPA: hypothetical protein OTY10_000509 [Enterococcus faecalis]|nr:hypothetical protein [Enterococcus faecalis]
MKKRFLGALFVLAFVFCSVQSAFASSIDDLDVMQNELYNIDFSKEPTDAQKALLNQYYRADSERVFNEEFAEQLFIKDSIRVKNALKMRDGNSTFAKEENAQITEPLMSRSSSSLGTVGDILVTYSFSSFGIDVAATGHAAIVHTNSNNTIESFPNGGVRVYPNDWKNKSKVYGVRVRGASYNDYKNAASYAIRQANAKKPYNKNFFNKGTTAKFYCSQLVWRAWKNQGFEVDRMNLGNYEPVSPAELVGGDGTYVFYKR